jgi:glyoxylate reductase
LPGLVLITRPIPEPGPTLVGRVAERVAANAEDRPLSVEELRERVRGADAVLSMLHDPVDASVLEAAEGCRVFANMAVGFNNIDVAEATRRGILVTNTPGVLTEATADLTWALILGVARRVVEGDAEMRGGRFPGWGPLYMLGGDVTGRALGLVGPGRIAAAVAERARGFKMPLLYHGRGESIALEALGARRVSLEALLGESDFVSLHVPLSAETHHMIDARALALMKPTAYLINTARGPVVDERALVEALAAGRIAGAGLDVYEDEPRMAPGLAGCPTALLLPHLGSATHATRAAMSRIAGEDLVAVLRGRRPANPVNPEVLSENHGPP